MKLFCEYYNSDLQCLLDLFSLNRPFSEQEAAVYIRSSHVDVPAGGCRSILSRWVMDGLLQMTDGGYVPGAGMHFFAAPLNQMEADCLAELCAAEAASWFLPEDVLQPLTGRDSTAFVPMDPPAVPIADHPFSEGEKDRFRTLLDAIRMRRMVEYRYRTAVSAEPRTARMSPFRLEYSVFDGRWWLISYSAEEDRTVKSRLENLLSPRFMIDELVGELRAALKMAEGG